MSNFYDLERDFSDQRSDSGGSFTAWDDLKPLPHGESSGGSEALSHEDDNLHDGDDPYYHPPFDFSDISDIIVQNDNGKILTDAEAARYARQQALSRTWQHESGGVLTRWGDFVTPAPALETAGMWLSYPATSNSLQQNLAESGEAKEPSFQGLFQVNMLDTEAEALAYRSHWLFGRNLTAQEWGELVGAPDGARIVVRALPDGVLIEGHPESSLPVFLLVVERAQLDGAFLLYSRPAAHLIDPTLKPHTAPFRSWIPAMLARCARKCNELGIEAILCESEGTPDTPDMTGYCFWPTLGFDSAIIARFSDDWGKIPPPFRVPSVLDLYSLPDGPEVWARAGTGRQMVFQTAPFSRSQRVLASYGISAAPTSIAGQGGLTSQNREWMQKQIPSDDMTAPLFHPFTQEFLREGGKNDPYAQMRRRRVAFWIAQLLRQG